MASLQYKEPWNGPPEVLGAPRRQYSTDEDTVSQVWLFSDCLHMGCVHLGGSHPGELYSEDMMITCQVR